MRPGEFKFQLRLMFEHQKFGMHRDRDEPVSLDHKIYDKDYLLDNLMDNSKTLSYDSVMLLNEIKGRISREMTSMKLPRSARNMDQEIINTSSLILSNQCSSEVNNRDQKPRRKNISPCGSKKKAKGD